MTLQNKVLLDAENYPDIIGKKIKQTADVYNILLQSWDENRLGIVPDAKLLLLDAGYKVINVEPLLNSGFACFDLHPQTAILCAIKANAQSFILAQSNPFGVVTPSIHDFRLAENLIQAGEEHNIPFLDYLMISDKGYYSYALNEYHLRNDLRP